MRKTKPLIWISIIGMLLLGLSSCAHKAFYYPDRADYGSPAQNGLPFEPVTFKSYDGTALSGWFVPAQGKAKGTVIHFHCNAQNISAHWGFVNWLPARGFNVFMFDYRGYGKSEGKPNPRGLFEDGQAAIDYVRSRPDVNPEKLVIFGQSLGGANAIGAVGSGNKQGVKAVAVEATFQSYSDIANDKFVGAGVLMSNRYSAEKYVAGISPIPLLLIHGTADEVIPYKHGQALFDLAGKPTKLVRVEGGHHLEATSPRFKNRYRDELSQFFTAALKK